VRHRHHHPSAGAHHPGQLPPATARSPTWARASPGPPRPCWPPATAGRTGRRPQSGPLEPGVGRWPASRRRCRPPRPGGPGRPGERRPVPALGSSTSTPGRTTTRPAATGTPAVAEGAGRPGGPVARGQSVGGAEAQQGHPDQPDQELLGPQAALPQRGAGHCCGLERCPIDLGRRARQPLLPEQTGKPAIRSKMSRVRWPARYGR